MPYPKFSKIAEARRLFNDTIFEIFKEADNCDRVIYQLMRAYDIFSKTVNGFSKMSTVRQYFICETAVRIAIAESDRIMRKVSVFRDKGTPTESEVHYGLYYGYSDPSRIDISSNEIQVIKYDFKGRNKMA